MTRDTRVIRQISSRLFSATDLAERFLVRDFQFFFSYFRLDKILRFGYFHFWKRIIAARLIASKFHFFDLKIPREEEMENFGIWVTISHSRNKKVAKISDPHYTPKFRNYEKNDEIWTKVKRGP